MFYSHSLKKKKRRHFNAHFKEQTKKNEIVPFLSQREFYPPAKCLITLTQYHHAFCFFVKERYRISKSTHIYFIQIYIEFKYYISIWSFDTNQENPTIFKGKDMYIF